MTSILEPFASKRNPNETGTVSVYASVNQDSSFQPDEYPSLKYLQNNYYDKEQINDRDSVLESNINSKVDKTDISSTLNSSATSGQPNAYSQYYINTLATTLDSAIANKINKTAIVQTTGTSTTDIMSQKAVSDQLNNKLDNSYISSVTNAGATANQNGLYNQYYINNLQNNLKQWPVYRKTYLSSDLNNIFSNTTSITLNASSTDSYTYVYLNKLVSNKYNLISLPTYAISDSFTGLPYNNCGIEGTLQLSLGPGSLDYDLKVVLNVLIMSGDIDSIDPLFLSNYIRYQLIFPVSHRQAGYPSQITGTRSGDCHINFLNQVFPENTSGDLRYYKFVFGLLYKAIPPSSGTISNSTVSVYNLYSRLTTFVEY